MRIVLPKASRGYHYDRLFLVEMNDFDVERLLPSFFYLIVTRGRPRSKQPNSLELGPLVSRLAAHPSLDCSALGSDAEHLLEQWVRNSVVKMGRAGRGRAREQIEAILPVTFAAYKAGLPAEVRRQRNVHIWLYRSLIALLESLDSKPSPVAALDALFRTALGSGLEIGAAPDFCPRYDGVTPVDIHTLLALCFLDGFEAVPAANRDPSPTFAPALPDTARAVARDVLLYVIAMRPFMPPLALTRGTMALINLELLVYTIALAAATNELCRTGCLPEGRALVDGLDFYVDFTRERGSPSDELARTCVERHLEELRRFYDSSILLRTLDRFVQFQPKLREQLASLETPRYLEALFALRGEPSITARAQAELESILQESLDACQNEAEKEEVNAEFDNLRRTDDSPFNQVVELLANTQVNKAIQNWVRWYWTVGGLRKPFGLLSGNLSGKRNWRYSMSDELLLTLVQLAMIDDPSGDLSHVTMLPRLPLRDFLRFLRIHFGILVDSPPSADDSVASRAAARDNLDALRRRLRQLGWFEALSDDFTAQHLRNPLWSNGAIA